VSTSTRSEVGPSVTVVVTTRDRPELAQRALASALGQTRADVEVVVVDDGSRPPFVPAVSDPRVRVVRHEVAAGVGAARNAGLAAATGAWITFLDDDDELEPHMVEQVLAAAAASTLPPPVAINAAVRVLGRDGDGTVVVPAAALERGCDYFLEGRGEAGRSANGLVVPTAVLRAIGGFDEALPVYEHHDLGLRLNRVASIEGLAEPLYRMTADAPERLSARRDAIPAALEHTRRRHPEAFARHPAAAAQYLGSTAFAWLEAGAWGAAVRAAATAVVRAPASTRLWAFLAAALAGPRVLGAYRSMQPPKAKVSGWALQRARLRKYGRRAADLPRAVVGAPVARIARRIADRVGDPTAHPVGTPVLVCCIYRARHASTVARLVTEADAHGWEVRLWALDRIAPALAACTVGVGPGDKFPLLNHLLGLDRGAAVAARAPEWVVVADDDVVFAGGSLHDLLAVAGAAGLDFVQPAHVERSHRELEFTVRRPGSLARATTFVEIGPLFAVRRPWTDRVLPFPPEHTMGWGLELDWCDLGAAGMRLGIVDGVPVRHLSPVGKGYAKDEQRRRLDALLAARGLRSVLEVQHTLGTWRPWQRRPPWGGSASPERPPA